MIRAAFLVATLIALPASAADFCPPAAGPSDQLAGAWQGVMRGGVLVGTDGKPHALPPSDQPQTLIFSAEGEGLTLAADASFPAVTLAPGEGTKDFALPGESPLEPVELLEPEMAKLALACDPAALPRFFARIAMDKSAASSFDIFALSADVMVLVVRGDGQGRAARAVFDLNRPPKP